MKYRFCAAVVAVLSTACGSDPGPSGPTSYVERHTDGNTFACVTCHALDEPAADGMHRPGHPIGDAAARPSFKNGQLTTLLAAVNTCRREWMSAPAFAADDARWLELEAFLGEQAPAQAAALSFTRVDPPASATGGDADRGQALFATRCQICHGDDGGGTQRAPQISGLKLESEYIAERVRRSGAEDSDVYPGLSGGRMPFWSAERMSDAELLDIVAYVRDSEAPGGGEPDAGPGNPDDADGGGDSECEATHARVGQVAQLITRFHGVTGTATIVDDCTVSIEMFGYDGQGVDVRVYGAAGGAYATGFAMTGDLRRGGGYANATLRATLPQGQRLDELDGISIWCVPVGASFGDGLFAAP